MGKALLTRKEVAKILGVSPATVHRYEQRGFIQPIRLTARTILYRREDVSQLLERRKIKSCKNDSKHSNSNPNSKKPQQRPGRFSKLDILIMILLFIILSVMSGISAWLEFFSQGNYAMGWMWIGLFTAWLFALGALLVIRNKAQKYIENKSPKPAKEAVESNYKKITASGRTYYGTREAAQILGVKRDTITHWCQKGKLWADYRDNRYFIPQDELFAAKKYLQKHGMLHRNWKGQRRFT